MTSFVVRTSLVESWYFHPTTSPHLVAMPLKLFTAFSQRSSVLSKPVRSSAKFFKSPEFRLCSRSFAAMAQTPSKACRQGQYEECRINGADRLDRLRNPANCLKGLRQSLCLVGGLFTYLSQEPKGKYGTVDGMKMCMLQNTLHASCTLLALTLRSRLRPDWSLQRHLRYPVYLRYLRLLGSDSAGCRHPCPCRQEPPVSGIYA